VQIQLSETGIDVHFHCV